MKIEEHLDHWENPAMCIDPDKCPVVYARIMHEEERYTKSQTPFFEPLNSCLCGFCPCNTQGECNSQSHSCAKNDECEIPEPD